MGHLVNILVIAKIKFIQQDHGSMCAALMRFPIYPQINSYGGFISLLGWVEEGIQRVHPAIPTFVPQTNGA